MNAQMLPVPKPVKELGWTSVDGDDLKEEARAAVEAALTAVVKLREVFGKVDRATLDGLSLMFPREDGSSEVRRSVPQAFHDLMLQEIAVQLRKVHGERPGWLTLNTRRRAARKAKVEKSAAV